MIVNIFRTVQTISWGRAGGFRLYVRLKIDTAFFLLLVCVSCNNVHFSFTHRGDRSRTLMKMLLIVDDP